MKIEGVASAEALQLAIRTLGGTVAWPDGKRPAKDAAIEVEIDKDDAYDALDASGFIDLRDFRFPEIENAADVGDFVTACAARDRLVAAALVPRVFALPANRTACERALATPVVATGASA